MSWHQHPQGRPRGIPLMYTIKIIERRHFIVLQNLLADIFWCIIYLINNFMVVQNQIRNTNLIDGYISSRIISIFKFFNSKFILHVSNIFLCNKICKLRNRYRFTSHGELCGNLQVRIHMFKVEALHVNQFATPKGQLLVKLLTSYAFTLIDTQALGKRLNYSNYGFSKA